ncbi:Glucosamine-6-phosphate deaminase [compost metagenome]
MGIGSILQAKQILLMAKGEDKAEIIAKALQGPITTQCPASLLQTHSNVVVVVDQAAGRFL